MKSTISTLLFFVLFVSASITNALPQTKNTIENVFTLELKFGDENLPDEYLLANPGSFVVNDAGDIYISDEIRIKVYTKDGKPKLIIGRPGQGPGEFNSPPSIFISPAGYITASDFASSQIRFYNFYTPASKFIEKNRFDKQQLFKKIDGNYQYSSLDGLSCFLVNDKEKIYQGFMTYFKSDEAVGTSYHILAYEKSGTFKVLVKQEMLGSAIAQYQGQKAHLGGIDLGGFYWSILPDNKIVYINTVSDKRVEKEKGWYTFHIISFPPEAVLFSETTSETKDIEIEFVPKEIPKSVIDFRQNYDFSKPVGHIWKAIDDVMIERAKKIKYQPPFTFMFTDGYFVFTVNEDYKNSKQEFECIDLKTGKKVFSTTFAGNQRTVETTLRDGRKITEKVVDFLVTYNSIIKNGYLYKIKSGQNIYPVVEKYRIDPAVYGK